MIISNYKSSEVNYWILKDGNYTISATNDFLEFSSRAVLAKGGLISEIFHVGSNLPNNVQNTVTSSE